MAQYLDYPTDPNDGMDPRKLGVAMFVVALLGVALVVGSLTIDQKSPDQLYDVARPEDRTSARVQVTPDLWRGKHETPLPSERPVGAEPATPAPEPEKPKPSTKPAG